MIRHAITTLGICALHLAASQLMARSETAPAPLVLAENGQTRYRIVIARDADYGEDLAAKELAHFLNQITGAEFPIRADDAPPTEFEIVLGHTNRKSIDQIPAHLRTDIWEGFAIIRDSAKLFIMGNIPRGTLYGVYDLLDVELGVRFLTHDATHVPKHPTLKLDVASRWYGPAIERRTIWEGLGGKSALRNRMNGISFGVLDGKLGGVQIVGPKVHSFSTLVPADKHFDAHPEYFAQIEGERRREYDGLLTQLCMSNPEVAGIALDTIRGFLGPQVRANPYNKYIVSVTVNDSPHFCKCARCVAVNKEEGVEEGGTKMRFVNTIARRLAGEYPAVGVETMLYHTELPQMTRPVSNVLIQLVQDPDWRHALDDDSCRQNVETLKRFRDLHEAIGKGGVYNWIKLGTYGSSSYLDPRPNLRFIARNIRIMTEHGVKGLFCQTVQTRGSEMQALRYYLLARAMWRPEVDSRETIQDFCRLYYGAAAKDVLRYIDFFHDEHADEDMEAVTMWDTTVHYDDRYIRTADTILAEAESRAESPQIRQRVATCRLPVWKLKLDRVFGEVGKFFSFPAQWSFRIDPQDKGLDDQWQNTRDFQDWTTMRIDNHWTAQGEDHRGAAWYGIKFDMPRRKSAQSALWFGAIDGDADIFLDGEKVGEQKLPATSMWQHGFFIPLGSGPGPGEHTLVIRVFKPNYASGIWKEISLIDMSVPIPDDLRTVGERFIKVARAADLTFLSESYGGPHTQTKKMYYPKIEFFLKHGGL
jgi:hypothetical protein